MKFKVVTDGIVLDNNGLGYERSNAVMLANEIRRFDGISAVVVEIKEARE